MFHSSNISLRRWAYLSERADPGDGGWGIARGLSVCGSMI